MGSPDPDESPVGSVVLSGTVGSARWMLDVGDSTSSLAAHFAARSSRLAIRTCIVARIARRLEFEALSSCISLSIRSELSKTASMRPVSGSEGRVCVPNERSALLDWMRRSAGFSRLSASLSRADRARELPSAQQSSTSFAVLPA